MGSAIPGAGQGVAAAKWAKKGVDAAGAAADGLKTAERVGDNVVSKTAAGKQPSRRQSEVDVGTKLEGQGYRPQVSYKGGDEVPYGRKGSDRPEYSKPFSEAIFSS